MNGPDRPDANPIGADIPAMRASRLQDVAAQPSLPDLDGTAAGDGHFAPPSLLADATLATAVALWTASLAAGRPSRHTLAAYTRDLSRFETLVGNRRLSAYGRGDVTRYLADAGSLATRKRRLTSLRRFWSFVIEGLGVPLDDPTAGFVAPPVELQTPRPLSAAEQDRVLAAADADQPWSPVAIWLMLDCGLSRGEVLALRRDHLDLNPPPMGGINIVADDPRRRQRERRIEFDARGHALLADYLERAAPADLLVPYGFQAVNSMVARVGQHAGITRRLTPQTLRETFAVEQARAGATTDELIIVLGLADDSRNRQSVDRYRAAAGTIDASEPPVSPV